MRVLPVASVLLLLSACNQPAPIISAPPPEWTAPVTVPTVPDGDSDAEVAAYIIALHDALTGANNKLKRLDDWRAKVGTH